MQRNQSQSPAATSLPQGFAEWGMGEVAYIRLKQVDDKPLFVVHAANGETLVAADSHALAAAVVVQTGMVPLYAH
jgi:hypothetical protein